MMIHQAIYKNAANSSPLKIPLKEGADCLIIWTACTLWSECPRNNFKYYSGEEEGCIKQISLNENSVFLHLHY